MRRNNNKGAAMVTVLIAITFIAILTSSLLYAGYVNFLTKNTRTRSADNFYSDEFALDEVAASLQQIASDSPTVDDAHVAIRTAVGINPGATSGQYDASKLQDMIMMANKDPKITSITVTNACGTPDTSYTESGSEITFHDVLIKAEAADDYISNIKTDITINLPKSQKKGVAVNSFSVICDDTLYTNDNKSGNAIFAGNYYVSSKNPSQPAVKVDFGKFMQIIGEYAVIDGDLLIDNRSAMYVSGQFIVNGTVTVKNNSSLIVGGELYCTNIDIDDANKSKVVDCKNNYYTSSDHVHVGPLPFPMPTSGPGLAQDLLAKHLFIVDKNMNCFDVVEADRTVLDFFLGTSSTANNGLGDTAQNYPADCGLSLTKTGVSIASSDNPSVTALSSDEYYKGMLGSCDTFNTGLGALLLFTNRNLQIRNEIIDTTLITTGNLQIDQFHSMYVPHMSDYGYQAVINTLIKFKCNNKDMGSGHNFNAHSDLLGYKNQGDSVATRFDDGTVLCRYDELTGDVTTTGLSDFTATTAAEVDVMSSTRYVVVEGECSLIPYGYLLTSDTDNVIAKHVPMINPSDDSPKPTIQFKHWSKE